MKNKKNNKVKYGNIEIGENPLDPKNTKMKITIWLDADIVLELKKRASKSGSKYQTLINHILRNEIEQAHLDFETLEKRISKLEKKLKTA